jgi:hypothetical protein
VYGVRKVQLHLPRRHVNVCTLVPNYGSTNVTPTKKDKPPPLIEGEAALPNRQTVMEHIFLTTEVPKL